MSDCSLPPKRNRLKDFDETASLFLRKAHHLISNCPQYLGGWTENGETFIIKDAKTFSEKVIPTVYKHNNFSSFVRQLNFYGFKKIKSDLSSIENPLWEFTHPSFLKGSPELLSEIKRPVYRVVKTETSAAKETEELKLTIAELRERLILVDRSISGLSYIVSDFMRDSYNSPRNTTSSASLLYDGDPLAAGVHHREYHDCTDNEVSEDPAVVIDESSTCVPMSADEDLSGIQDNNGDDDDDNDSLDELLTLCKSDHQGENLTDSEDVYSNTDFEDFLTFASSFPEILEDDNDIRNRSISDIIIPENLESPIERTRARTLSAITLPVTVQDIPFIIAQLPAAMQGRFLDKFAEAAGATFTDMVNITRKRALSNEKLTQEECGRQRTLSQQQMLYERIENLPIQRHS